MIKVAVVILNFNGAEHLKKFLPSVLKYSDEAEVFVIDNGSTDESVKILTEEFSIVHLIRLENNYGFAEGYNMGLSKIEAQYYVILNSDVEVTPHWIQPMLTHLEAKKQYAACQPKILSLRNKLYFEHAGASGGFVDYLGYPFCRGRMLQYIEKDTGQYDQPIDVLWTSGACMMIRSSSFNKVGGFDPDFFAHMEEIDLCWRIYQSGEKLRCLPASIVYHLGGGTLTYGNARKTYLNFRNSLIMLAKNLPVRDLVVVLPVRLVLDLAAGISFKSVANFNAVLKANWDFYSSIKRHLSKRSVPKGVSSSLLGKKWIIFLFFFKRIKKFSDL